MIGILKRNMHIKEQKEQEEQPVLRDAQQEKIKIGAPILSESLMSSILNSESE